MGVSARVRCIVHRGEDVTEGIDLELEDGEQVVNIDHEGHIVYVYVAKANP